MEKFKVKQVTGDNRCIEWSESAKTELIRAARPEI